MLKTPVQTEEVSHAQKLGDCTRGTPAGKQTHRSISRGPLVDQDRAAVPAGGPSWLHDFTLKKKMYSKKELANLDLKMKDKGIWSL